MYTSEKKYRRGKGFFIFVLVLAGISAMGGIVMALWNAILPDLLHVSVITYWQSLGLLVLCKILFGGFRFGGGGRPRWARSRWKEKWSGMSEEEKAAFKSKWEEKCKSYRK